MSEFSESYHLESDHQSDGLNLLETARLRGLVFKPQHGWVSIFPESRFGEDLQQLTSANSGVLLRLLYEEDAGWMFEIQNAGTSVCYYECRWLDSSDPYDRIVVKADELNLEYLKEVAGRHIEANDFHQQLERILHPRIVRRSIQEGGQKLEFDDFQDWPFDRPTGETDNVAHAFAKLLRLPYFQGGWRRVARHGKGPWLEEGAVEHTADD